MTDHDALWDKRKAECAAKLASAKAALAQKGVQISISTCGCCGGANITLVIDGVTLIDAEDHTSFDAMPINA